MSENQSAMESVDPRFVELDTRLRELVRQKYREHWRSKDGMAPETAELSRYNALQGEIKTLFDEIRLIDKKYKLPIFGMHP